MRFTCLLVGAGLSVTSLIGCSSEEPTSSVKQGDEQNLTVSKGFHHLGVDDSFVYRDVAIDERRAYLAKGPRGVHVVDLETMTVVEKWTHTEDEQQLFVDGVQVADGLVIAWGQRDDRDPFDWNAPYARSFVLHAFTRDGSELVWSATIDIAEAILGDSSFVQLPNINAYVADGQIAISFGHIDHPDRVVSFPVPEGHASYNLLELPDAIEHVAVDNPKGITSAGDGFGYYVAQGPDGVSYVSTESASSVNESVGYAVDVRAADGLIYVANHDGFLHVLDAETAKEIDALEIPDWVEGIDVNDAYVVVGTREGLFVAPTSNWLEQE